MAGKKSKYICLEKTMQILELKPDLEIENAFLQVLDHAKFQSFLRNIQDIKQQLDEERNRLFNYTAEHGQPKPKVKKKKVSQCATSAPEDVNICPTK